MNSKQFEIGYQHAMRTKSGFGDQGKVMVVLLAPKLCSRQTRTGRRMVDNDFGHAGNEAGALVFPDDLKVRSITREPVACTIGDGKRLFLIRLNMIIILQQIHIGSFQNTTIVNHVVSGFLTGNTSCNNRSAFRRSLCWHLFPTLRHCCTCVLLFVSIILGNASVTYCTSCNIIILVSVN